MVYPRPLVSADETDPNIFLIYSPYVAPKINTRGLLVLNDTEKRGKRRFEFGVILVAILVSSPENSGR